jgi:hypothetical protein
LIVSNQSFDDLVVIFRPGIRLPFTEQILSRGYWGASLLRTVRDVVNQWVYSRIVDVGILSQIPVRIKKGTWIAYFRRAFSQVMFQRIDTRLGDVGIALPVPIRIEKPRPSHQLGPLALDLPDRVLSPVRPLSPGPDPASRQRSQGPLAHTIATIYRPLQDLVPLP